ncbi:MAG: hypothetical protein PHI98_11400 [Eubacteriales bacterium]|nr:hypothetical protein [Eubacteriales bacterium]
MSEQNQNPLGPEGSYYETEKNKKEETRRQKLDALFPILITGLYLVLGAFFHLWHPAWLLFLTIPLHYIKFDNQLDMLCNPIVVTLIYLVMGLFCGLWHPGWLIFLAIPIGGIISHEEKKKQE